jgi:ribosomal protein S18 acetylase RimI-like enzyme
LRDAPHAFGSRLIDWIDAPEERWRRRLEDVELNLLASVDEVPAGIASLTAENELISMWVEPSLRARGISDALIEALVAHAASRDADRVFLSVRTTNARAIAAYRRAGFTDAGWASDPGAPYPERLMVCRLRA